MIEHVFQKAHVRQRLQFGPLASVARAYVGHLVRRGYRQSTIQQYVQGAEHFAHWFGRNGRTLAQFDALAIDEFLARHIPRCRCSKERIKSIHSIRAALRQLLSVVGGSADVLQKSALPIDLILNQFEHHLTQTCGAAPATRYVRLREARLFLSERFGNGDPNLHLIASADLRKFVIRRAKSLSPASANCVASAIRSFIRFLHLHAIGSNSWLWALPRAAVWRLAHIPRVLTDDEVDAFLNAFDRTVPQGKRDYAIAVCLLDLGLRAGEVGQITLDGIDWRASTITLTPGKNRRGSSLPMPTRVARAVADYVLKGRPKTLARSLFVQHRPPRGQAIGSTIVRSAVRLAYARAGLDPRLTGTHVLRHTAATRLLRAGVSMKGIADILRHRSMDTSAIYAKVDLTALHTVALPWPAVRS